MRPSHALRAPCPAGYRLEHGPAVAPGVSDGDPVSGRRATRGIRRHWPAPAAAAPAPPTTSDAAYAALAAALTLQDPASPLVTAGPSPRGGRGLLTTRAVPAGTVLVSVDPACALVVADAAPPPPGSLPATALSDWSSLHAPLPPLLASYVLTGPDNWFARAVAWLAWAVRHGPPAWRLYGDVLPRSDELSSLMTFSAEEAQALLHPAPGLVEAAAAERAAIAGLHDRLFSSGGGAGRGGGSALAPLDLAPTLEHTVRWAALVNSRSFADAVAVVDDDDNDGGAAGPAAIAVSLVVPCVDLANHDADAPTARFGFCPGGGAGGGGGGFGLTAARDLDAGEEVTISYTGGGEGGGRPSPPTPPASKDSTRMLRDYGFVPAGNPADRLSPLAAGVGEAASLAPGQPAWERACARAAAAAVAASSSGAGPAALAAGRRAAAALASLADAAAAPVGGGGAAGTALVGGRVPRLADQAADLAAQAEGRAAECEAAAREGRPGVAPARAAAAAGWWAERAALARAVAALLEGEDGW